MCREASIMFNLKFYFMKEKENAIKTTPLLLELIEQGENKVIYILRSPQSGQVLCIADSADELCQFLDSLTS